jgi:hypothetical protein
MPGQSPPPEFPESMEAVRARVRKLAGKIRPTRSLEDAVPAVRHHLEADDDRRRKAAESLNAPAAGLLPGTRLAAIACAGHEAACAATMLALLRRCD